MVMMYKSKGKFRPEWERLFVVETVYSNGEYRLSNPNGDMLMMPINDKTNFGNTVLYSPAEFSSNALVFWSSPPKSLANSHP